MRYEKLAEDGRLSRRTVADALEVLRTYTGFTAGDYAEIQVGLLKPPSEKVVGLVFVKFTVPIEDKTYLVSLPTSDGFHAFRAETSRRVHFDIAQLDGAVVDDAGNVRLDDGMMIRAAEIEPAYLPLNPSELDWRIINYLIAFVGAKYLDFRKVSGLKITSLKDFANYIVGRDPTLKLLSHQKISDTLRQFGIRIPIARRPVSAPRTSAAI